MKTWLSWSSGKDSAWTLQQLMQQTDIKLTGIFVTVNQQRDRVAMHGTKHILLEKQLQQLDIPYHPVYIPEPCDNQTYQAAMQALIAQAKKAGVQQMAFGDLFLENIRNYREQQLADTGIKPIFPLWQQPTNNLAKQMIATGLKAIICCLDTTKLSHEFIGREFDEKFLADLPADIDPCGENGEFHTFVYDGPMFNNAIDVKITGTHQVDQFVFADIQ